MDQTNNRNLRDWKILCWNIRGLNSDRKWDFIRSKVLESKCDIICLQETKMELFDLDFIKNICPPSFNQFEYLPSVGASGGCITIWKGSKFTGILSYMNQFGLSVELTSTQSGDKWILTNIYGPADPPSKPAFVQWLKNIDMPDTMDWLIVGDFNLLRGPEDRNKPGGHINEMVMFNDAISALGLV